MLSEVILNEIFNIRYKVNDQVLDCISDELDKFRCVVHNIINNDHAITIYFKREIRGLPVVNGEIRIDRIAGSFNVVGSCGYFMLPVDGDWSTVAEYLRQLTNFNG